MFQGIKIPSYKIIIPSEFMKRSLRTNYIVEMDFNPFLAKNKKASDFSEAFFVHLIVQNSNHLVEDLGLMSEILIEV